MVNSQINCPVVGGCEFYTIYNLVNIDTLVEQYCFESQKSKNFTIVLKWNINGSINVLGTEAMLAIKESLV